MRAASSAATNMLNAWSGETLVGEKADIFPLVFNRFVQHEVFAGNLADESGKDRDLDFIEIKRDLGWLRSRRLSKQAGRHERRPAKKSPYQVGAHQSGCG